MGYLIINAFVYGYCLVFVCLYFGNSVVGFLYGALF